MSGSDATRVISIAGDPVLREALTRALREAGFIVTIAAPEEATFPAGASFGTGSRNGAPPQVLIVARAGGAPGAAFQASDASGARAGAAAVGPAQDASAERSLAAVCHDLRTPLSVMIGWVHLMQSGKLDEAGMKRAIEKLHDSLREQVHILDKMLEVPDTSTR